MKFILLFLAACCGLAAFGQRNIKGRTVDDAQEHLEHVAIYTENNRLLANTDAAGRFGLALDGETERLVFTLMGYQTVTISTNTLSPNEELVIVMHPVFHQLQEVEVSTGFQRLPRERATGSFDYISNETFNQQVSTDVVGRLEAVANGLTYNRSTSSSSGPQNIQVRGVSTILGDQGPLIVLDNFPYEGDINNINPNDVQDITILKDAAASSIWGARAGNGVIVITTKKGRPERPIAIDVNTNFSTVAKPDLQYLDQITAKDFIGVERFLFDRGYRFADTSNRNRPPFTEAYEILFARQQGELTPGEADALLDRLAGQSYMDQLGSHVYQQGIRQQYALNISGGSERVGWITSAGYDRNEGELGSTYNRFNIRMDNTYRPIQTLDINTSVYLTQTANHGGRDGYYDISSINGAMAPYTQIADAEGNALPVIKDYRPSYLQYLSGLYDGRLLDWQYYPLEDYMHRDIRSNMGNVLINAGIMYRPISELSITARYRYENERTKGRSLYDEGSYDVRNLINRFSYFDETGSMRYQLPFGSMLDASNQVMNAHQVRGQLDYEKTIGRHAINALAGMEVRHTQNESDYFRTYGLDSDILTTSNVDFVNVLPVLLPVGRTSMVPNNAGFGKTVNRFVSGFANAGYTYNSIYTLTLSGRRDASNLFGVSTNQKWRPLWSAGFRYEVSKEPFYQSKLLPYLNLRLTYGFRGNIDPNRSAYTTISYNRTNPYTQTPIAIVSQFANPELRWEKVGMWNMAVDFAFKNQRVAGTLEYYQKKAEDLFGSTLIDYTTGISTGLIKNVASMAGRGVDLNITSQNLISKFRWATTLNLSYTSEKITDYQLRSERGSAYVQSPTLISALAGKPVHAVFSYRWHGLDSETGDPLGDINGNPSTDYNAIRGDSTGIEDLVYHGSYSPTLFGSLGNDFSWKGITLSVRLMYKMGYYFRKSTINYSQLFENRRGQGDFTKRWQHPGDELFTNVPSMPYPSNPTRDAFYEGAEVNVLKGDHIRIQYINLGYAVPKRMCDAVGCSAIQVYMNLNNMGIIWRANDLGIDPEYLPASSIRPPMTTAFGCRINF